MSVSQNDTPAYCRCENAPPLSKAEGGSPAGPIIRAINQVAAEVKKKYPPMSRWTPWPLYVFSDSLQDQTRR